MHEPKNIDPGDELQCVRSVFEEQTGKNVGPSCGTLPSHKLAMVPGRERGINEKLNVKKITW